MKMFSTRRVEYLATSRSKLAENLGSGVAAAKAYISSSARREATRLARVSS